MSDEKITQCPSVNKRGASQAILDAVEKLKTGGFADIDSVPSWKEREAIVKGYTTTAVFSVKGVNKAA